MAAPFATRQLADLGARVIKIERPEAATSRARYDAAVNGASSYFVWLNRGKESLTLDLKEPGGRGGFSSRCSSGPTCSSRTSRPAPPTASAPRRTRLRAKTPAPDHLRDLRLRRRGPVPRQEGLRPAGAGRRRAVVGHRQRGRPGAGRHLGRRHRRRHDAFRASCRRCSGARRPDTVGMCPCRCSMRSPSG